MRARRRGRWVRRGFAVAASAVALGLAPGCGGGDDGGDGLDDRAQAVVACLEAAGKQAVVGDTVPAGVEVPTAGVTAEPLPNQFGGDPSSVRIWLFEDEAAAEDSRVAITLSPEDTQRTFLLGRAVVVYGIVPPDEERPVFEGCLEPPES